MVAAARAAAVVYGEESPVVTPEGVADVAAANPRAQVTGIAGAGHMIPWDNLDDFLRVVRSFLATAAVPS